jgi:hypothetical protein
MISLKNTLEAIKQKISGHEERITALEEYSTDEKVIGTWINGKPLYRKVIVSTTPSSTGWSDTWYNISSLNIETCVNIGGFFSGSDGRKMTLQWADATAGYQTVVSIKGNYLSCGLGSSVSGWKNTSITVILEYTKTTD